MSKLGDDIKAGIKTVGSEWKKAKKNEFDKNDMINSSRLSRMREYREPKTTLRMAAFQVMEQAYNEASTNGRYYANARQIMYAARPRIIRMVGINGWASEGTPKYFQELLKDYMLKNHLDWKVVWDARGHFREPHTKYVIGLGGAEVMDYSMEVSLRQNVNAVNERETVNFNKRISTVGPKNRYGAVLFIEKEGFYEQLEGAGILEKWDIAIMSSKGIPNGASCNVGAMIEVPVLALHDFDLAGFTIVNTLRNGARLSKGISNLIDIGLRYGDVKGLESEPVVYTRGKDPRKYLKECGATPDECEFLAEGSYNEIWSGHRVEINALSTENLIALLERKFIQYGVKKVVPDEETLLKTYQRSVRCQKLTEMAEKLEVNEEGMMPPDGFVQRINDSLAEDPSQSWDEAIWKLAEDLRKKSE